MTPTSAGPTTPPAVPAPVTLKALREQRGLTQQEFAKRIRRSRATVAAWEYGRSMSLKSRAVVAKFFNVDPEVLGRPFNPRAEKHERLHASRRARLEWLAKVPISVGLHSDVMSDSPDTTAIFGGGAMAGPIPDLDQFQKILAFWCAMHAAARMAFLATAWEYARPEWRPRDAPEAAPGKAEG